MRKIGLILGVVNTVAIAAVLGLFVYTKVIYKHPPITEKKERAKLVQDEKTPLSQNLKKATIAIEPITANLDPYTDSSGQQKIHYVSIGMSVEIRDEKEASRFDEIKPILMDRILQNLSKKKFEDLNQVQGRYVFRSQIIDAANEILRAPIVTEVYFTEFLLQ